MWFGQIGVSLGTWMDQTARSWLVYSMTHSALQLGLINAVRGAPQFFFGIVAGVFADRYSRKIQLYISQITNAVLNIILATLIFTGRIELWHIYVTGFLVGTVQAFEQPARQVLVSDLVGKKYLFNAISLNSAGGNVSRIVGPAICALLIVAFGVAISYYVQAAMFIVATVWTFQVRVPISDIPREILQSAKRMSFFASTKEGFQYILNNKVILSLMVLSLAPMLLGSPYINLVPIFAVDVFHGNASTQGLILTLGGVGAITGALVTASFSNKLSSVKILIGAAAGYGLGIFLFGRSPVLWMALGATFFSSMAMAQYQSQNQTLIQIITPSKIRGRVLGVYMLSNSLYPLGSLLAGAMAQWWGGPTAVTLMGAACFLVAIGIALFSRSLWRVNIAEEREKAAEQANSS